MEQLCRSSGDTRRVERELSVYDIVLCVYERFRVDGLKRYVNDDRFRVDGDKNMRLLAFAFTIVFVWTGPKKVHVIQTSLGQVSKISVYDITLCRHHKVS